MIGGCFANASAASPPAVYFAKQPPIIHLLPTRLNVMGLIASVSVIYVWHRTARVLAKAVSALAICVIMNVIAVGFGDDITDAAARKRIEGYFPGRDVHIIEMLASWYDGGGVHCHTNDQPAL
jgi:agmatine/peptidylarginine deiminase